MAIRRDEQYEGFDWQRQAACRGEHAPNFFPPPHFEPKALRIARERTAKAICRQCPVSTECLAYALESREPHGVWGGLNEVERRELLDTRPLVPTASTEHGGGRDGAQTEDTRGAEDSEDARDTGIAGAAGDAVHAVPRGRRR